jgi:lysozyme
MQTSSTGYALIEQMERFSPTVTGDTGDKQEIGFGHDLLYGESFPNGITESAAIALLHEDVAKIEPIVSASVPPCSQNQFDALIDFTYECGLSALHELLSHGWSQVATQLPRWVYASVEGQETIMAGMVVRRAAEVKLFLSQN